MRWTPRIHHPALAALCGALALCSGDSTAIAQDAPATDPAAAEPFFEAVHVQVVNVDVWVTDREGRPVEGLGREDFLVLQDGEPVEVTNFYAVADGRAVTPSPTAEATGEATEVEPIPPPRRRPELAPEHRLWLVVYVDNANIEPLERDRILPALESFLGRALAAGGRAMVVTYDRSLEVRQPFTDELPLLREAIGALRGESGLAVVRNRERMDTLQLIDQAADGPSAMGYARNYAEDLLNTTEYTIEALGELVETLAGLPGRKALVHVSSGVPMLGGEEAFHAVAEKFNYTRAYAEIPRHDATRQFERVVRRANAQRVSFHTMDAGGLRGLQFGAAEYGGFVDMDLRSTLDSVVPENLQSSLRLLAGETGGRAILNRNEVLPALDEVVQDFRSFYSLGISASDVDSGRYHRLEVRLRDKRRGVGLRHRAGYRSKSLDTRVRESLSSALMYAHQENPLDVELRWGEATAQGDTGLYMLPIQVRVPLRDVALLPTQAGRHEARLGLYVGAVGPDSRPSPIQMTPFGLRLDNEHAEAARAESLLHGHRLLLNRGQQKIGVAVLDLFGGQASVVTTIVQVGPEDDPPS